jgi:hypothetical protein
MMMSHWVAGLDFLVLILSCLYVASDRWTLVICASWLSFRYFRTSSGPSPCRRFTIWPVSPFGLPATAVWPDAMTKCRFQSPRFFWSDGSWLFLFHGHRSATCVSFSLMYGIADDTSRYSFWGLLWKYKWMMNCLFRMWFWSKMLTKSMTIAVKTDDLFSDILLIFFIFWPIRLLLNSLYYSLSLCLFHFFHLVFYGLCFKFLSSSFPLSSPCILSVPSICHRKK